jgi:chromosome segregation ATPase
MAGLRNATEVELAPNYKKKISELDLATTKKVLEGAKQKKADAEKTKSYLEGALANLEQIPEEARDTKEVLNPVTKTKTSATVVIATVKGAIKQYEAGIATASESVKNLNKLVTGRENAKALLNGILEKAGSKLSLAANLSPALANMPKHIQDLAGVGGTDLTNGDYAATYEALQAELKGLAKALDEKIADIKTNKKTFDSWDDGYKQLKAGQEELSDTKSGVPFAFKMMLIFNSCTKFVNKQGGSPVIIRLPKAIMVTNMYFCSHRSVKKILHELVYESCSSARSPIS